MKDIILGAADNYNWEQLKPWVRSIKETGFSGETWLITYRIDRETLDILASEGVLTYEVHTDMSKPGVPSISHNRRFYDAWELIFRLVEDHDCGYRYVTMTDVSDVIFQRNPSYFLERTLGDAKYLCIAPSEGITFENEEWNKQNLIDGYGPVVYDFIGRKINAYNVGTIAAPIELMGKLCFLIYNMTLGKSYPADQSSWNMLVNFALQNWMRHTPMSDGWAAQLGTTHDPTKTWLWGRLNEPRPVILDSGYVTTQDGTPFVIVHQYNRVPSLKHSIPKRYDND